MTEAERIERLRELVLALPLVTERVSHGSPSWFVESSPMLASLDDHHHGADHLAVWLAAAPGVAAGLVEEEPGTYFVPPYVGVKGWLGVRLAEDPDWDRVADLLSDAWDVVAKPAQGRRAN